MINIRIATEDDIPNIEKLLVEVNIIHHNIRPDLFNGPAVKYTKDELKSLLKKEGEYIFAATDKNDNLVGYIMCNEEIIKNDNIRTEVKTLYIDDLCVDENFRGEHIGQKLYNYAKTFAKENNFYNLTLHVWEGNDSAYRFYQKQGMKTQYTCLEEIL